MGFDIESWIKKVESGDVIIKYTGIISSETISSSMDKVEASLIEKNESPKVIKKIYNVMVECLQNLFHHSELIHYDGAFENGNKFGAFVLKKEGNKYFLTTGNYINDEKIQFLRDRIVQLNSLSIEEIKALYKMVLNNEEFSEKGGGGLGMIDVIKRTESKINYEFISCCDNISFYSFGITIEI